MKLAEYAAHDALGLAALVARREVTPRELAATAAAAIALLDQRLGAVVETYPDRIEGLDERSLGSGPFRGVPMLIKDVFGHGKGRRIEFGSRLCEGMTAPVQSHLYDLFEAAGLNILGRSKAPEFSMSPTTESLFAGNTSTPWRAGYSAGGSSGGAQAAVTAGIVPIAHGSDIGGSIRIPASWCGGVGLKPSRGRISIGPSVDEGGFGMSMNFVQAKSVRDAAAMLDCLALPQPGDPFVIPKPAEAYAALARRDATPLRIGLVEDLPFDVPVDRHVQAVVEATARMLEGMGHRISPAALDMRGREHTDDLLAAWFFAFDARLDGYGARTGRRPGPDTLEPQILALYEWSRSVTPARFVAAMGGLNAMRRRMGRVFSSCDVLLSPATARVSEPWGTYSLARVVPVAEMGEKTFYPPCQFTVPHNIMGTPAISLPLAMHPDGLPIGVQLAARPAEEHILLQLATSLEQAAPWAGRVPPLHVSKFA